MIGIVLIILAITIEYYVHYFNNMHLTQMEMVFQERPINMSILVILAALLAIIRNRK